MAKGGNSKLISNAHRALEIAASIGTATLLLRTVANDLLPAEMHDYLTSAVSFIRERTTLQVTATINERDGAAINDIFTAAVNYLGTKMAPSTNRITVVYKEDEGKCFKFNVDQGTKVVDVFDGVCFKWELRSRESNRLIHGKHEIREEVKYLEVSFHKKHRQVFKSYLAYIFEQNEVIKEEDRTLKLYVIMTYSYCWTPINLTHPAKFDTIAMDPDLKKEVIDDLVKFVNGKEYYKKIGKPWKRGYLLYGPPGTGKSSLVAAMAQFLRFDLYDLVLSQVQGNAELREYLVKISSRSIIIVEDIDCDTDLMNREATGSTEAKKEEKKEDSDDDKVTLSGLLNCIDGLWSGCGDGRIVVFTTNYKAKLDPALLRPGRMDKHIYMGYCGIPAFRAMVQNYHDIDEHPLFEEIEKFIGEVDITPAEVAEELLKSYDFDVALRHVLSFLQRKKQEETDKNEGAAKISETN